jgi:hypothetical protein
MLCAGWSTLALQTCERDFHHVRLHERETPNLFAANGVVRRRDMLPVLGSRNKLALALSWLSHYRVELSGKRSRYSTQRSFFAVASNEYRQSSRAALDETLRRQFTTCDSPALLHIVHLDRNTAYMCSTLSVAQVSTGLCVVMMDRFFLDTHVDSFGEKSFRVGKRDAGRVHLTECFRV